MKQVEPMGAYWSETKYTKLYQLQRRVEQVATELGQRRFKAFAPLKKHITELHDIAIELKILDKKVQT